MISAETLAQRLPVHAIIGPDLRVLQIGSALARVCGAPRWVRGMLAAAPFTSRAQLLGEADRLWWRLGDGDWKDTSMVADEVNVQFKLALTGVGKL
jgi:hypothetical protein